MNKSSAIKRLVCAVLIFSVFFYAITAITAVSAYALHTADAAFVARPAFEPDDWAKYEIDAAHKLDILPADAGMISYTDSITRAEFCEIIVKTYEANTGKSIKMPRVNPFTDTDDPYILKAYTKKIVGGYPDGTFKPNDFVTHQEAAKIICNAMFRGAVNSITNELFYAEADSGKNGDNGSGGDGSSDNSSGSGSGGSGSSGSGSDLAPLAKGGMAQEGLTRQAGLLPSDDGSSSSSGGDSSSGSGSGSGGSSGDGAIGNKGISISDLLLYDDAGSIDIWALIPIYVLSNKRIMNGNEFNEIAPHANLTREEAMVLAFRALSDVNGELVEDVAGVYITDKPGIRSSDRYTIFKSDSQLYLYPGASYAGDDCSFICQFYSLDGELLYEAPVLKNDKSYNKFTLSISQYKSVWDRESNEIRQSHIAGNIYDKLFVKDENARSAAARGIGQVNSNKAATVNNNISSGANDASGASGVNSDSGVNGVNDSSGVSGVNDVNGVSGANSVNGVSGTNSVNGVNGVSNNGGVEADKGSDNSNTVSGNIVSDDGFGDVSGNNVNVNGESNGSASNSGDIGNDGDAYNAGDVGNSSAADSISVGAAYSVGNVGGSAADSVGNAGGSATDNVSVSIAGFGDVGNSSAGNNIGAADRISVGATDNVSVGNAGGSDLAPPAKGEMAPATSPPLPKGGWRQQDLRRQGGFTVGSQEGFTVGSQGGFTVGSQGGLLPGDDGVGNAGFGDVNVNGESNGSANNSGDIGNGGTTDNAGGGAVDSVSNVGGGSTGNNVSATDIAADSISAGAVDSVSNVGSGSAVNNSGDVGSISAAENAGDVSGSNEISGGAVESNNGYDVDSFVAEGQDFILEVIQVSPKGTRSINTSTVRITLSPYINMYEALMGSPQKRRFDSDAQAKKHMKTILINVWKIGDDGDKYASEMSLSVNRAVADDVQEIFQEIFDSPEQFPIKSIGGYDWRGGARTEHNIGTAIDINPTENAFISSDGTILAGSFYAPYENPYSLPEDGSVVQAFLRHGWGWGGSGWTNGKDYMHLSYFGT